MKNVTQTDLELLQGILRPEDANESYVTANNQYGWYRAIAEFLKPRVIGEIGVHCGYSLWAMHQGAPDAMLFGWDNESIVPGCLGYVEGRMYPAIAFFSKLDTQSVNNFPRGIPKGDFDLFHVDGDHTPEGCCHDMELAWEALRDGGTMLVDDVDYMNLRPVVEAFAKEHNRPWFYLPTFRGMGVIKR